MRFFLGIVLWVVASTSGWTADEPVVIGDVAMPEVNSSDAFKQVEKKVGKIGRAHV